MRHRKKFNHLGRKSGHRKAMLANMANSLILHKKIETTTAKAKALRMYVEPLITKSKDDTTHSRRVVFSYLQNKVAVSELFREISPKIMERPGGYTRILKTGNRLGDNADMCIIELVDYNENLLAAKDGAKAKAGSKRRRRGGKKTTEGAAETKPVEAKKDDIAEDAQVVEETNKEEVVTKEEVKTEEASTEAKESTEEKKSEEDKKEDPKASNEE